MNILLPVFIFKIFCWEQGIKTSSCISSIRSWSTQLHWNEVYNFNKICGNAQALLIWITCNTFQSKPNYGSLKVTLRRLFRMKFHMKFCMKDSPKSYFRDYFVRNNLRSTSSEIISYEISYEISYKISYEVTHKVFHREWLLFFSLYSLPFKETWYSIFCDFWAFSCAACTIW